MPRSGNRGSGGGWGRLYRLLLGLYPPAFRGRFAEAMAQDFQTLLRDERARGARGAGRRAFARALGDLVRSLPREWSGAVRRALRDLRPLEGLRLDVRQAVRGLVRDPRFTLAVGVVLALGFGLQAGALGIANAYLIRPLPFPASERLVALNPVPPLGWDEVDDVFEAPVSWDLDQFTLLGEEGPEAVRGAWVTPGFFEIQASEPALGRGIRGEETGSGEASVILVSWGLWQRRWGGDPGIIGETVTGYSSDRPEDAEVWTIVGVLPRDFWFINRYTDVLAPLRAENPVYMGRLHPHVTLLEAEERLTARSLSRIEDPPEDYRVTATPVKERYVASLRPTLLLLLAASGLVLLIAAGNAGVLFLLRAGRREQELGVRRALGAGRLRITRQLLLEAGLLVAGAAALGLWGGHGGLTALGDVVQARLGTPVPGGAGMLGVDATVVGLTLSLAGALALALGLLPLLTGVAAELRDALRVGGRGSTEPLRRRRIRHAMVSGELALTLALLIAAGLAVRSAGELGSVDLGFEPAGLVKGRVDVRRADYPESADRARFFDQVLEGVRALPEVASAGAALRAPLTWNFNPTPVQIEGGEMPRHPQAPGAVWSVADSGYFATMGIPLIRGRLFGASDVEEAPSVALVSRAMAQRFWPDSDALGRRFRFFSLPRPGVPLEPGAWHTVVGIVGDVRHAIDEASPAVWVPYRQGSPATMELVVKGEVEGASGLVEAVQGVVRQVDPRVPVSAVASLEEVATEATAQERFLAALLGSFATLSLILAVVGLYGVVAYAAAQGSREVAIRMVLGADGGRVVRGFLGEAGRLVCLGTVTGLVGAYGLARLLAAHLYGVEPWDPILYGGLASSLAGLAAVAAWIPALRASRVDPARVLREG